MRVRPRRRCWPALGAHILAFDVLGNVLIACSGLALMWPTTARPQPAELPRIWALVNATARDPVAPFAMLARKSYHFTPDGVAAIAYRTRLGYAVVSGDPIGDESRFTELVSDFVAICHAHGWRVVVLGCSERRLACGAPRKSSARPCGRCPLDATW